MAGKLTTYRIYSLQSPSGRQYVGLTKTSVWQRWRGHVKRSRTGISHPLYNAIRKYGEDAFTVAHIASAAGKANAQALERVCIAQIPPGRRYNISPGGEADGEAASKVLWDRMRADPAAMEVYRAKLIEAQRNVVLSPASKQRQLNGTAKWRADNPRTAWKTAHRASRISAQSASGASRRKDDRTLKEKLLAKHKSIFPRRAAGVAATWAARSAEEIAEIGARISESRKAEYAASPQRQEAVKAQLGDARASIDREYQAARASAGQKAHWAKLKADPVRYAEYMARRIATFKRNHEERKHAKETSPDI
jgi:hypothetical protein